MPSTRWPHHIYWSSSCYVDPSCIDEHDFDLFLAVLDKPFITKLLGLLDLTELFHAEYGIQYVGMDDEPTRWPGSVTPLPRGDFLSITVEKPVALPDSLDYKEAEELLGTISQRNHVGLLDLETGDWLRRMAHPTAQCLLTNARWIVKGQREPYISFEGETDIGDTTAIVAPHSNITRGELMEALTLLEEYDGP